MNLKLNGWKKVKTEGAHTTLVNKHGHELKIMHSALNPGLQDQLSKLPHHEPKNMADGGRVSKQLSQPAPKPKPDDYQVGMPDSPGNKFTKWAQSKVGFAEGGQVEDKNTQAPVTINIGQPSQMQSVPAALQPGAPNILANEAPKVHTPALYTGQSSPDEDNQPFTLPGAELTPFQPAEPQAAAPQQEQQQPQQQATPEQSSSPAQATPVQPHLNSTSDIATPEQMFAQGIQANNNIGAAQQTQLKNQSTLESGAIDQSRDLQKHYDDTAKDIHNEIVQAQNAYKDGSIDPNKYWDNHSKIAAGIGLILGGIGGGLTHQENPALKFLNQQIERNVESQKANLNKQDNLMHFYMEKYHNLDTATQMTKMTNAAILGHQLESEAAKSGSKIAMDRAHLANVQLMQQYGPLLQQTATKQALASMNSGAKQMSGIDPAIFVPKVVPAEHQKEVFSEIQRAQDTRKAGESILADYDKVVAQFKRAGGLGRIGAAIHEPRELSTLHAKLGTTVGDLEGSVRQAAMDNVKGSFTPQKDDTDADLAKRRAGLVDYLGAKSSAPRAKAFGIDLDNFQSTSHKQEQPKLAPQAQSILSWAKQNPDNPKAQAALKRFQSMGVE